MRQTWALLVDAYRDLNSRKMFWIVLILSALVAASFACVKLTPGSIKIILWEFPLSPNHIAESNAVWQKSAFVNFGVEIWLTWAASILAIISTASIFPSLITGGAIDLYLSKPISRLRLFFTKYFFGLLFVALQVACYCLASYLVIGLRGREWKPGIFLAIPIVVLFYSYLFCICVLIGVITRSTVSAILLTLLFWLIIFGVQFAEKNLLLFTHMAEHYVTYLDRQIEQIQRTAPAESQPSATHPATHSHRDASSGDAPRGGLSFLLRLMGQSPTAEYESRQSQMQSQLEATRQLVQALDRSHRFFYHIESFLPKTEETVDLLEQQLIKHADLPPPDVADDSDNALSRDNPAYRREQALAAAQTEAEIRARPVHWVVGTSVIFEGIILLLAAWVFCRRDY